MVDCVIFDLMDTLVRDPYREALRAGSGMSLRELFTGRDLSSYLAFERGEIDEATYWAAYREQGVEMDVTAHHRVRREGTTWLPGMRRLVLELRESVDVAVASNYGPWLDEHRTGLLDEVVDVVIGSYQLGVRKPDAAFFHQVSELVGHDPTSILFIDDRQENVDGARAAGMDAVVFTDADTLRGDLVSRRLLPG